MPDIFPITNVGLPNLISDFGIQVTPRAPLFYLSDTIVPVSLVKSQIDITAKQVLATQTWTTEGEKTAPATGTLLADTGELVAGVHSFWFWVSVNCPTSSGGIQIQHRDAANAATNVEHLLQFQNSTPMMNFQLGPIVLTLVSLERVRAIKETNGGGGDTWMVSIFTRPES